jgi:hypothetical protein
MDVPDTEELQRAATEAHRQAVESSPTEMARYLQDALGQRMVAYITNVATPRTVARWVKGQRTISSGATDRLAVAYQIFRLLGEDDSSYVVRGWFAGLNPLLDDTAPATVIREGRFREALAAARAYASNA